MTETLFTTDEGLNSYVAGTPPRIPQGKGSYPDSMFQSVVDAATAQTILNAGRNGNQSSPQYHLPEGVKITNNDVELPATDKGKSEGKTSSADNSSDQGLFPASMFKDYTDAASGGLFPDNRKNADQSSQDYYLPEGTKITNNDIVFPTNKPEEVNKLIRSINYAYVFGAKPETMFNFYPEVNAAVMGMEAQSKANPQTYNPLAGSNWDAALGVDPIMNLDAGGFAELLYPLTKFFQKLGYSAGQSLNEGLREFANTWADILEMKNRTILEHVVSFATHVPPQMARMGLNKFYNGEFREAAKAFDQNAAYWKAHAKEIEGMPAAEFLGRILGGIFPGIVEWYTGTVYAGLKGAAESEKRGGDEIDQFVEFLKGAAIRGTLGKVFNILHNVYRPARMLLTGIIGTANTAYEAHGKGAPITGEMLLQAFLTNAVFGYPGDRSKVGARAVEKALAKVHSENTPGIPQGPRAKLAEEKGAIGETPKGLGEKLVPASPEEFIASRGKSSRPQYLTQYNADDLGKMALFKIEGKDAGYALKPDGDLVNVFNATNEKGMGDVLVRDAISKGANKLDCYDGWLAEKFYPRHGFEVVKREPWDEAYRPANWLDMDGTPDIIFMQRKKGAENASNPGKTEGVDAGRRASGYSEADSGNVGVSGKPDRAQRGGVDNEQQAPTPPRMGVLHPESLKPTTAETGIKSQTKTESPSSEGVKAEGSLSGSAVSAVEKEGTAAAKMVAGERSPSISIDKVDDVNIIRSSQKSKIAQAYDVVMQYMPLSVKNLFDAKTTDYRTALEKGEQFYRGELMKTPVRAPAFDGGTVKFDWSGFLHISGQDARKLSIKNIIHRLNLLPKAREVLKNTPYVDGKRIMDNGDKYYGLLGRFDDGSVIRVVVKETGEEGRMFRTVFDWDDVSKKVKRTPPPGSSSSQPGHGVGGAPSELTD